MMVLSSRRFRILPVTIAVMAVVLCVKSVGLFAAVATPAAVDPAPKGSVTAPGRPEAKPSASHGGAGAPTTGSKNEPPRAEISDAERTLLLDLRRRRDELDARARALDARQTTLDATEAKLRARLDELTALQGKLEQLDHARNAEAQANWSGLVRTYEAMKPREAAAIFDQLDTRVLLPVLDRMNERRAAAILAAMQPDRARIATQLLADLRVRQTTPTSTPGKL